MKGQRRIGDYGIRIGRMKAGDRDAITDVAGVTVGHVTICDGNARTGVTAILPHQDNIFREKLMASCHVINGFGKSMGLVQVEELGTLETPIILTNTLSVGDACRGLVEYMVEGNGDIGDTTGTVNPVVCECNDGFLNDIRGFHVKPEHVLRALEAASSDFEEGDIGAGKGMSCYQLKGGIGSASRIVEVAGERFTVGVLVLSNFGTMEDLVIDGVKAGRFIYDVAPPEVLKEQGSIITVLATDAPLTERQIKRLCKRASVGITRTGAIIGNGSGEIVVGFSTAGRIDHYEKAATVPISMFNDNHVNLLFRAVVEATEESVLNSLICASPVTGRDGHHRRALEEFIRKIPGLPVGR